MAYTPQVWVNGPGGATPLDAARLNFMETGIGAAQVGIALVAPVTANGALALGTLTPANASGGAISALTLPTGKVTDTVGVVKTDSSSNTVTITGSIMGSSGSYVLSSQDQVVVFISDASHSWWPVVNPPGSGGSSGLASIFEPVDLVSTNSGEVTSSPPSGAATVDQVAVVTGNRVLLTAQSTNADKGIWVANTAGLWTRPADFAHGATIADGALVGVGSDGANYYQTVWMTDSPTGPVDTGVINFILVYSLNSYQISPTHSGSTSGPPFIQITDFSWVQRGGDSGGLYISTGSPNGVLTSNYFVGLCLDASTGDVYTLTTPGGNTWAKLSTGGAQNVPAPVKAVSYNFAAENPTGSPPSGAATIDGYAVSTGDRILLNFQSSAIDNGIWLANTAGAWTRPTDWATGQTIPDGTLVMVAFSPGSQQYGTGWITTGDCVVGTDPVNLTPVYGQTSDPNVLGVSTAAGTSSQIFAGPEAYTSVTHTGTYAMSGQERPIILGNGAITLPNPGVFLHAAWIFKDNGSGTLVLHPHGSEHIDGASTLTFSAYQSRKVWNDGTNWFSIG